LSEFEYQVRSGLGKYRYTISDHRLIISGSSGSGTVFQSEFSLADIDPKPATASVPAPYWQTSVYVVLFCLIAALVHGKLQPEPRLSFLMVWFLGIMLLAMAYAVIAPFFLRTRLLQYRFKSGVTAFAILESHRSRDRFAGFVRQLEARFAALPGP
jgi:hypothetical protein